MTCRDLAELLIDYVQGELDPELHEHVTRHVCMCPPCEAFVESYRITIQLTRRLPPSPMPPELCARLDEALRRHRDQGPRAGE